MCAALELQDVSVRALGEKKRIREIDNYWVRTYPLDFLPFRISEPLEKHVRHAEIHGKLCDALCKMNFPHFWSHCIYNVSLSDFLNTYLAYAGFLPLSKWSHAKGYIREHATLRLRVLEVLNRMLVRKNINGQYLSEDFHLSILLGKSGPTLTDDKGRLVPLPCRFTAERLFLLCKLHGRGSESLVREIVSTVYGMDETMFYEQFAVLIAKLKGRVGNLSFGDGLFEALRSFSVLLQILPEISHAILGDGGVDSSVLAEILLHYDSIISKVEANGKSNGSFAVYNALKCVNVCYLHMFHALFLGHTGGSLSCSRCRMILDQSGGIERHLSLFDDYLSHFGAKGPKTASYSSNPLSQPLLLSWTFFFDLKSSMEKLSGMNTSAAAIAKKYIDIIEAQLQSIVDTRASYSDPDSQPQSSEHESLGLVDTEEIHESVAEVPDTSQYNTLISQLDEMFPHHVSTSRMAKVTLLKKYNMQMEEIVTAILSGELEETEQWVPRERKIQKNPKSKGNSKKAKKTSAKVREIGTPEYSPEPKVDVIYEDEYDDGFDQMVTVYEKGKNDDEIWRKPQQRFDLSSLDDTEDDMDITIINNRSFASEKGGNVGATTGRRGNNRGGKRGYDRGSKGVEGRGGDGGRGSGNSSIRNRDRGRKGKGRGGRVKKGQNKKQQR